MKKEDWIIMVGSLNSGDTRTGYKLDVAYDNYVLFM